MIVEILVNYYTKEGKVWVYHRDIEFTAEVKDRPTMLWLESDVARAIRQRGKLLSEAPKS
jgi:hypothetical protein